MTTFLTQTFDPNAAASENSGIFGLPFSPEESRLVLLPVPWEATTSYGGGTAKGPQAILRASRQVDLFDLTWGNFYEAGIAMLPESPQVIAWNQVAKQSAKNKNTALVNTYSDQLNQYIYTETKKYLAQNKIVGIVGGDHSSPFGGIQAILEQYPRMGILHIDAHADMRQAYEGFQHSHASIMYNVLTQTNLPCLVQVGIRDFCEEEFNFIQQNSDRVSTYFDWQLFEKKINGISWHAICQDIIQRLPSEIYISFDIDGLDPRFCPHTGTPVPGGLEFYEAIYLIKQVVHSGRKIIGFDLNEVSLGNTESTTRNPAAEWDANVAARLLYQLCGCALC